MNKALAKEAKEFVSMSGTTFTAFVERAVMELLARNRSNRKSKRYVPLPVCGDPKKKITSDEYKQIVEALQLEDDLRSLGLARHDTPRRQRSGKRLSA